MDLHEGRAERHAVSAPTQLHIAGEFRPAMSGRTFAVEDPSSGRTITEVADGDAADAVAALDAACAAQDAWAATPPRARADILRHAYELLTERSDQFAELITLETGKPLREARGEVGYGGEFLRWFSERADQVGGSYRLAPDGASRLLTNRVPVGPCLLVTPWNFPLAMVTRKVGPALAAGCTVVVKPAEQTPLTALLLAQVLVEAGLPAGVVNVVAGQDPAAISKPLLNDRRLRKLSFTGSTEVGRVLLTQAAPGILRTSMELGGNAPFLIFSDADVDAAVDGALIAKLRNSGQTCVAANRFLVHRGVAADFTAQFSARVRELVVGPGSDPTSEVGPLIDGRQRDRVVRLVQQAVGEGADFALEGGDVAAPGYFYRPCVLTNVPLHSVLAREEIFGPVAPISVFDDDDAMIAAANDTEFGLVAYAYTRDLNKALGLVDRLEVGMVGINRGLVSNPAAPFGGVKQSGLGREGGEEGIEEYLSVRYASFPY